MKRIGTWLCLTLLAQQGMLGCSDDTTGTAPDGGTAGSGGSGGSSGDGDGDGDGTTLVWQLEGLEPLGPDHVYEGWIVVDGEPLSTGRFDVDADGKPSQTRFSATQAQADTATAFVLSIEPRQGDDPAPAATKLLGGDMADGSASLSIAHGAALGDDLQGAQGTYILNTPTTANDDTDYHQGIWWLVPPTPEASLDLPVLPEGWAYEGWVVGDEGPVSTGRFTDGTAADSDGPGPTAGPDSAPPFPGQDYIDPAVSLLGQVAVISVEPEPDDSPMPFALKPLVDTDVEDKGIGLPQDMANNAAMSAPSGSAWFE